MRKLLGWWFPTGERHIPTWMIEHHLIINGRESYQGHKQLTVLEYCKKRRTAVDVGAHVGLWSFNLCHEFDQVQAFEPVADHRECFAENLAGNENVHLHAVALGAESGGVSIYSEECNSGYSYVSGSGDIPLVTLDSFDLTDVDLIKIDCEGYEENVVRGAVNTINRDRPVIIVEQKRDMAENLGLTRLGAVELLKTMGYSVAKEISGDYIMVCN